MSRIITLHAFTQKQRYGYETTQFYRAKIARYLGWDYLQLVTNPQVRPDWKADLKKLLRSPLRQSFEEIKNVLESDPYKPIQSFEKLTPPAAGYYSRRINGQHRVVYTIDKVTKIVEIYSCWAHYESGNLEMSGKSNSRKN